MKKLKFVAERMIFSPIKRKTEKYILLNIRHKDLAVYTALYCIKAIETAVASSCLFLRKYYN